MPFHKGLAVITAVTVTHSIQLTPFVCLFCTGDIAWAYHTCDKQCEIAARVAATLFEEPVYEPTTLPPEACMHMYAVRFVQLVVSRMQMVELVSSIEMNASCMRMSAMRLHTLSWVLGLALSLRMQASTDEAALRCGVCGHVTHDRLCPRGILYSKGQWMLWHIQRNHDLVGLFEVQFSDSKTTMEHMKEKWPGLVKPKW